ncbi:MAG: type II toxin-antitoxin system YafQ family toxin [Bifidobacteriaceae bacterium]|nr:type II toxin-antitoxin system YafQ family toxin [Bifidobacteriaceae bacterium]
MRLDRSPTNQFKRDVRLASRRGVDLGALETVINRLAQGEPLEAKARDHG